MSRAVFMMLAGLVAGLVCDSASATPLTLTLSDGSTTKTIVDNGADDLSPVAGAVVWTGAIGSWILNASTGVGLPVIGTSWWPQLDLNSVNTSIAPGTLTLLLTQGGFPSPPPPGFLFAIGGTTQGSVDAYACAGAALGDCEQVHLGPFTTSGQTLPFSSSISFPFSDPGQDYQLGIKVVLTHGEEGKTSSFDAALEAVPEPGTYALIGAGLLGLGILRRRLG